MNWKKALALAAAMGVTVFVTPAHGDDSYPPAKYDIGGATETETLENFRTVFPEIPLYRVHIDEAYSLCDGIWFQRYAERYPASEVPFGSKMLGCLIRDSDKSNPVIVYPYDPDRPWLSNQILRHEIGHLMGWPGTHERN